MEPKKGSEVAVERPEISNREGEENAPIATIRRAINE